MKIGRMSAAFGLLAMAVYLALDWFTGKDSKVEDSLAKARAAKAAKAAALNVEGNGSEESTEE